MSPTYRTRLVACHMGDNATKSWKVPIKNMSLAWATGSYLIFSSCTVASVTLPIPLSIRLMLACAHSSVLGPVRPGWRRLNLNPSLNAFNASSLPGALWRATPRYKRGTTSPSAPRWTLSCSWSTSFKYGAASLIRVGLEYCSIQSLSEWDG